MDAPGAYMITGALGIEGTGKQLGQGSSTHEGNFSMRDVRCEVATAKNPFGVSAYMMTKGIHDYRSIGHRGNWEATRAGF